MLPWHQSQSVNSSSVQLAIYEGEKVIARYLRAENHPVKPRFQIFNLIRHISIELLSSPLFSRGLSHTVHSLQAILWWGACWRHLSLPLYHSNLAPCNIKKRAHHTFLVVSHIQCWVIPSPASRLSLSWCLQDKKTHVKQQDTKTSILRNLQWWKTLFTCILIFHYYSKFENIWNFMSHINSIFCSDIHNLALL